MRFDLAKISKPKTSRQLATFVAKICDEKIASDILIIDLSSIESAPADFFVLCSCDSQPQVKAISDEIFERTNLVGLSKPRAEGIEEKEWVLIDYFDVVAHIMLKQSREYYRIERLWADGTFYVIGESGRLKKLSQKEILELVKTSNGDE